MQNLEMTWLSEVKNTNVAVRRGHSSLSDMQENNFFSGWPAFFFITTAATGWVHRPAGTNWKILKKIYEGGAVLGWGERKASRVWVAKSKWPIISADKDDYVKSFLFSRWLVWGVFTSLSKARRKFFEWGEKNPSLVCCQRRLLNPAADQTVCFSPPHQPLPERPGPLLRLGSQAEPVHYFGGELGPEPVEPEHHWMPCKTHTPKDKPRSSGILKNQSPFSDQFQHSRKSF